MSIIKLTKKQQLILDTLQQNPYSVIEIVNNIENIQQNLLKFIYEDISSGKKMTKEKFIKNIPQSLKQETTIFFGDIDFSISENVIEEAYQREELRYCIQWLRFNYGTAMVGLSIEDRSLEYPSSDVTYYIHKPFWDRFSTDKKIRIEEFDYTDSGFTGDDFPRLSMCENLYEVERINDWVVCKWDRR